MTLSEEASARIPRSPRRPCLSVQRNRRDPSCPDKTCHLGHFDRDHEAGSVGLLRSGL